MDEKRTQNVLLGIIAAGVVILVLWLVALPAYRAAQSRSYQRIREGLESSDPATDKSCHEQSRPFLRNIESAMEDLMNIVEEGNRDELPALYRQVQALEAPDCAAGLKLALISMIVAVENRDAAAFDRANHVFDEQLESITSN